jgi:hypothetical protein
MSQYMLASDSVCLKGAHSAAKKSVGDAGRILNAAQGDCVRRFTRQLEALRLALKEKFSDAGDAGGVSTELNSLLRLFVCCYHLV